MKNFKRNVAVMGIMMAAIYLTGCSSSIVALNDDETKVVARYIADKLLQNDINYKKTELVYTEPTQDSQEEVPETPAPDQLSYAPEPTEAPVTDNPDTPGEPSDDTDIISDWSEFFTTDEWSITYSSYDTYKSYPESDVYSIDAAEGNQLLVLFFDVKNLTDEKIKVNLIDSKPKLKYKLYIGDDGYVPKDAVLENGGLMYLKTSIPAGKTDKAELVFEVPEETGFADMRLDVVKGNDDDVIEDNDDDVIDDNDEN